MKFDNSKELEAFDGFLNVIKSLRDPENGCPWDLKQSDISLRKDLLEESYETVEAIINQDHNHIKEELGDVLLLVNMIGYINEQNKKFTITEIIQGISDKLIRRHPHVFGETKIDSVDDIISNWEDIKVKQEGKKKKHGSFDDIAKHLPPLERSYKIQKVVEKVGFDWENKEQFFDKLHEEIDEIKEAIKQDNQDEIELELGDILFTVVNLARKLKVSPIIALERTNQKFIKRFQKVEEAMQKRGLELSSENFQKMDNLWDDIKKDEK